LILGSYLNVPACYYPKDYSGYHISKVEQTADRIVVSLTRDTPSGWLKDSKNVKVEIYSLNDQKLRIKIFDVDNERFEVPFPKLNISSGNFANSNLYQVEISESGILRVRRTSTSTLLLEADLRKVVFSDQFIEFSYQVPFDHLYGLGEHKDRFQKDFNWKRYVFFNRDGPPTFNQSGYGTHPFYLMVEKNQKERYSHGVMLFNSNAMETILQPTPAIIWRTIGGILDFYIFLGPTAADVVRQNIELLGRPYIPPYWGLGFHLCRFGYNSIKTTRETWKRTIDAKIPFDVQWNDIDYMNDQNDFTFNNQTFASFSDFIDEVHQNGMHYVLIFVNVLFFLYSAHLTKL